MATALEFPHYFVLAITLVCAITDLRSGRIYNAVTYPSMLLGLVYNSVVGGEPGFWGSLVGLLVGLVPLGFAAGRGWIGAGDVKLFGAIGAVAGPHRLLDVIFLSFAIAALFGVGTILVKEGLAAVVTRFTSGMRMLLRGTRVDDDTDDLAGPRLRLGLFIFVATVFAAVGWWMRT